MKTKLSILLIVLTLVVSIEISLAQTSSAPTVTFNVPLQLSSLHPDVTSVRVLGSVLDAGRIPVATNNQTIVVPSSGNVNQTVTIVASQLLGKDITQGRTWEASFQLSGNGITGWTEPTQNSGTQVQTRAKDGTTYVPRVAGTLTW